MIRVGVTGTDTGVGKTVIAAALVSVLRRRGLRVAAMKPVETGAIPGATSDAGRLRAAAGGADRPEDVCPVAYVEPLAPLVAGDRAHRGVDLAALDAAFVRLTVQRDAIVVEGAGGLLVPLTERLSYADLFLRWHLDLVVVGANRLGVINHLLLTVHAAHAAGLSVRAIVLNDLPGMIHDIATETNAAALVQLLPTVPVVAWPTLAAGASDATLAAHAERCGLDRLIDDRVPAIAPLNSTEATT